MNGDFIQKTLGVCSELLYQIKEVTEYFDAGKAIRKAPDLGYGDQIHIANDFFAVAGRALDYSVMVGLAKLCSRDDGSVDWLYRHCKSNEGEFNLTGDSLGELREILSDFESFRQEHEAIVLNIKIRRNKYYAHNDKKYFQNRKGLVDDAPLSYDDIENVLNSLRKFCMGIYFLLAREEWKPVLHQGCLEHPRNCNDLYQLLNICNMDRLDFLNQDPDEYSKDRESYQYLINSLEQLFHCYLESSETSTDKTFCDAVLRDLKAALDGASFDEIYVFSFEVRTEYELTYVSFDIEADYIEVHSGGSVYDPRIGSDSYSNSKYILGESDADELASLINEAFGLIQNGAKLAIELPETYIDEEE